MKKTKTTTARWEKSRKPNLRIYVPTGVYHVNAKVAGKLFNASTGRTTEAAAVEAAAALIAKRRAELASGDAKKESGAVSIYLDQYAAQIEAQASAKTSEIGRTLKPSSAEYKREVLDALKRSWPGLAELEASDVTEKACRRWALKTQQEWSPTRYNGILGTLRGVLQLAVEDGQISSPTPADKLRKAKIKVVPQKLPTLAELDKVVEDVRIQYRNLAKGEPGGNTHALESADLIEFLAYTGLRRKESALLRKSDIDIEKGQINLPAEITKNGLPRSVPLSDRALPIAKRWLERTDTGARLTPIDDPRSALKNACKRVGVVTLSPHKLRHFFITKALEAGVPVRLLAHWVGHQDGGALILKRYSHVGSDWEKQEAKKLSFA